MPDNFTGYVLAGGKSSRMGADKFSLSFEGETFLTRAVKVLKPVCESVKIVLNQTQTLETDAPVVRDIYTARGANAAIHAALKDCDTKFALILAVDLPLVTTAALANLTNPALLSNKYLACVPRQADGKPQPLCAVYRAKYCVPALEKLLGENEAASVRDFLDLISPKYIDAGRLGSDENLLFNVNYPEDFKRIQKITRP
jgi:molybdopterin-guanine dinucleotide biosynthesis protein A